jgi:biopolymer transport protein TolQ
MLLNAFEPPAAAQEAIELDPLALLVHASGPVWIVSWVLIAAAIAVWIVAVLKLLQIRRLDVAEASFNAEAGQAQSAGQLIGIARRHPGAPGARVVLALARDGSSPDLIEAHARRALVAEEQRAGSLLGVLSTIGSAGPFVGLFGTVWGILDAFLLIGREKSASLPVVAPAIGEALISTAVGLFAAIPAVVAFNAVSARADDLLARVEAASEGWIAIARRRHDAAPAPARSPLMEPAALRAPAVEPYFPPVPARLDGR